MSFGGPTPAERLAEREAQRAVNMAVLCTPSRALTPGTYAGTTAAPVQKRVYIRSRALLAAVRKLPCQHTGETVDVEAAHSNWSQHGKAGRIKADDNRVAALHRDVHRMLDQGSTWSAEERQRIWWQAHICTVRTLVLAGKWPPKVPVPQLEDFWK